MIHFIFDLLSLKIFKNLSNPHKGVHANSCKNVIKELIHTGHRVANKLIFWDTLEVKFSQWVGQEEDIAQATLLFRKFNLLFKEAAWLVQSGNNSLVAGWSMIHERSR